VTLVFWIVLKDVIQITDKNWEKEINHIMDHSFPLAALLIDYSMNCIPIVKRHFSIVIVTAAGYVVVLMWYSINGYSPFSSIDWSSFEGTLYPILVLALSIVIWFLLEFLNRKKLSWIGDE